MASRADMSTDPEAAVASPLADVADPDSPTTAPPKIRSRKDGAAIPLEEVDRKLLNLMQGSFPISPRPFRHVAEAGGVSRARGDGARAAPARQAHHPPGNADLRHACSRLLLDARRRQGRPRAPAPRRAGHQRTPRRLAQLPAQPRVQPVVHDRHRARLQARPRGHPGGARTRGRRRVRASAAHAAAVQDPHGPGDGGRHRRALRAPPRSRSRSSSSPSPTTSSTSP